MKRLLLLSLFSLFTLSVTKAQIGEHRNELSFGVSGGYMLSQVGFLPEVPQKWHTGKTAGITLRYTSEKYFNSICAIVGELNFVQVGWKEDLLTPDDEPVINSVTGVAEEYQRDMNYLQLPVFARLGWGRERRGFQFFFQAGPQFGYLLSEKTKSNFEFGNRNVFMRTSPVVAQDTMAVEHRFDYGIAGGIGLEWSHPRLGHFMLEGRYYYGLGDIFGNTKRDYFARSYHSQITIKLSYLFDFTRSKNYKIK